MSVLSAASKGLSTLTGVASVLLAFFLVFAAGAYMPYMLSSVPEGGSPAGITPLVDMGERHTTTHEVQHIHHHYGSTKPSESEKEDCECGPRCWCCPCCPCGCQDKEDCDEGGCDKDDCDKGGCDDEACPIDDDDNAGDDTGDNTGGADGSTPDS